MKYKVGDVVLIKTIDQMKNDFPTGRASNGGLFSDKYYKEYHQIGKIMYIIQTDYHHWPYGIKIMENGTQVHSDDTIFGLASKLATILYT